MPYFYDPGADEVIACLPTCCSEAEPQHFPPVRYGEYLMERIDANYSYRGKAPVQKH
jgi:isopenicillin N synthase-like dioxygenase